MAYGILNDEHLIAIGDAIRAKKNVSTTYKASEMAAAINSLNALQHYENISLTTIPDYTYSKCKNLSTVSFPNVTEIGKMAFFQASNLNTINIPLVTTIGMSAFWDCDLTTIDIPLVATIEDEAFRHNIHLTTVTLPAATTLKFRSFYACAGLVKVDLPVATKIEDDVFEYCTSLETLIIRSNTVCQFWNSYALANTKIANGTGYIYVPRALVETYKVTDSWPVYANQFRAIEDYPEICG